VAGLISDGAVAGGEATVKLTVATLSVAPGAETVIVPL
jgi:hypothetical protein